jgi:hypothetical protein
MAADDCPLRSGDQDTHEPSNSAWATAAANPIVDQGV